MGDADLAPAADPAVDLAASRRTRVAMISVHTSPLDAPGTGDAGGMNVYVAQLASRLAATGVDVDVYTRAPVDPLTTTVRAGAGTYRVVALPAGPPGPIRKEDLRPHLPGMAARILDADLGPYDVVHSHYWLSGEVAATVAAAWHVPVVHMMHTMAAVKNVQSSVRVEPAAREAGERRLARAADALVVSTVGEAADLADHYDAPPERIHVVTPGVDLDVFTPRPPGQPAEPAPWLDTAAATAGNRVVLFAGRIQPHKGPDLLVRALAWLREQALPIPTLVILGGPSGSGDPNWLHTLAVQLGVADVVVAHDPVPHSDLARWYRAADLVAVPSRHESFGLVALEAQACGVPVVAAAVGGLTSAVADGRSGVLVEGRDPAVWGAVIGDLLADDQRRQALSAGARAHAEGFSWRATAQATIAVYAAAASPPTRERTLAAIRSFLDGAAIAHANGARPGELVAAVPGEHRLVTTVSVLVGEHTVSVSAFVCRHPDEALAAVHAWLLRQNARLPGLAFAIDGDGDIYLVARLPRSAVMGPAGPAVLDSVFGAVARTADDSFDEILRRGFASAIRAEHRWRTSRGLSTGNLAAFADVLDDPPTTTRPATDPGLPGPVGDLPGLGHD